MCILALFLMDSDCFMMEEGNYTQCVYILALRLCFCLLLGSKVSSWLEQLIDFKVFIFFCCLSVKKHFYVLCLYGLNLKRRQIVTVWCLYVWVFYDVTVWFIIYFSSIFSSFFSLLFTINLISTATTLPHCGTLDVDTYSIHWTCKLLLSFVFLLDH